MQKLGLQGKTARRHPPRTTQADPSQSGQANILKRQFGASTPDTVWLTDITYIDTDEGYLYGAGS